MGTVAVGFLLAISLACGASGGDDEAAEPYLRGPFLTASTDTALPPVTNPFPSATPIMHFAWSHPNLPANERIAFALVALDVGQAAAPNTTVVTTEVTAVQAGPNTGRFQASLPRPWPPGSYRGTATGASVGLVGTVDFTVQ